MVGDPEEERNLVSAEPDLAADLELKLEDWVWAKLKSVGKTEDPVRQEGASMVATWRGVKATVTA